MVLAVLRFRHLPRIRVGSARAIDTTPSKRIRTLTATEIALNDHYPVADVMMDGMGFARPLDFEPMLKTDVAPEWPTSEFDATYRVDIEGDPDIHCAMTMGAAEGHAAGHAATAATAMRVVNAIHFVVDAAPGLLSSRDIPTTLPRHVFG